MQVREQRSVDEVYEFIKCCENDSNANSQIRMKPPKNTY